MSVILASKNISWPKVYVLGPVISVPVAVDEMANQSHNKIAAAFLKSFLKKKGRGVQATLRKAAKDPKL